MATCAYRCTQRDDCCAFEFSRIKKMCQLQSECFPNNPPLEDYRFCQKCKYNLSYCWFVLYTRSVATWRGSTLLLLIILMDVDVASMIGRDTEPIGVDSKTLVAPKFVFLIGRDTEPIVVDSRTLVAPKSIFLIGGDTAQTVDVSDLPQKTEGGVTGRTEAASRSPSTTRL